MLTRASLLLALAIVLFGSAWARDVRLTDKGEARCVIIVSRDTMAWEGDDRVIDHWGRVAGCTPLEGDLEKRRRLRRDSVADLVLYLGKISGATVEIAEGLPANEKLVPVYIGRSGGSGSSSTWADSVVSESAASRIVIKRQTLTSIVYFRIDTEHPVM